MDPVDLPATSHSPERGSSALPRTIPAVVRHEYGGPSVARVEQIARPEPGAGEVLLAVEAAGLDRAVLHLTTGLPSLMRLVFGMRRPRDPGLGGEVAGRVVALGAGVTGLTIGDRVAGTAKGSFAAYALAHPKHLAPIPDGVSSIDASAVGVSGVTAWEAVVEQGKVAAGQGVLVLGASGGVGSFAVQLAHQAGATVTAVCRGAKAAYVRELGADAVVDYESTGLAGFGGPFDVIIDIAGNNPVSALRRCLAPGGRLVIVGGEGGGRLLGGIERNLLATMAGWFTAKDLGWMFSSTTTARCAEVARLITEGAVTPVIDRTVDLDGAADAIAAMASGHLRGHAVLEMQ